MNCHVLPSRTYLYYSCSIIFLFLFSFAVLMGIYTILTILFLFSFSFLFADFVWWWLMVCVWNLVDFNRISSTHIVVQWCTYKCYKYICFILFHWFMTNLRRIPTLCILFLVLVVSPLVFSHIASVLNMKFALLRP